MSYRFFPHIDLIDASPFTVRSRLQRAIDQGQLEGHLEGWRFVIVHPVLRAKVHGRIDRDPTGSAVHTTVEHPLGVLQAALMALPLVLLCMGPLFAVLGFLGLVTGAAMALPLWHMALALRGRVLRAARGLLRRRRLLSPASSSC